jgi:hypothetical protein
MGKFPETANVNYRLSFADRGKQTSVFRSDFRIYILYPELAAYNYIDICIYLYICIYFFLSVYLYPVVCKVTAIPLQS